MKHTLLAAAFILPLTLSGCIISVDGDGVDRHYGSWKEKDEKNRNYIANLSPDMTFSQITNKLGTPDFNESFQRGEQQVQVLFYRTQRKRDDGITTKDECTPLILTNGVLVGWGEKAYNEI